MIIQSVERVLDLRALFLPNKLGFWRELTG